MAETSPSLTNDERAQLKQFVRLVQDMVACRFIQRVREQDHSIRTERMENGEFRLTAPDYDWEDYRSFLTTFRQVALSQSETVYLPRIRNIVARHASDDLRKELGKLKNHIVPIIEGKLVGIRFGQASSDGEVSFTSHQLLDTLVNGTIFHSDLEHDHTARLILSAQPWQYILLILNEIIIPVLNACTWLVNVIQIEGYLDEADVPTT
jgi:hypothetical protein